MSGDLVWAVENIMKTKNPFNEETSFDPNSQEGFIFFKIFISVFMIIFYHVPIALLAFPWLVGAPIACAGTYPFAAIWITMLMFMWQRPSWNTNFMTIEDLKKNLTVIRGIGPTPTNQPESGGPLSIDSLNVKMVEDFINQ